MALTFSSTSPNAVIFFGGDFSQQLAQRPAGTTIVSASIAVAVIAATGDGVPGSLELIGSPFLLNSTIVSQQVTGGVAGALYTIQFTAPLSNGETLVGTIDLPISTKAPSGPTGPRTW